MRFTAIIVDDERLARRELRTLLMDFEKVSIVGEAETLSETVELLESKNPDVVFLDIQLFNENGFDLLEMVEQDFKVIFITAFDEFAIRAFEVNALDYLLKPINPERLSNAIERLFDEEETQETTQHRKLEIDDKILLEINDRASFLSISDISHIIASGNYTELFMNDGQITLIEKPLKEWEERLPKKHFTRIHRSTIININQIEKLESLFNRTMEVQLKTHNQTFKVSRRYTTKLKEKFG